ncbi:MAG: TonB-dependent receptor [Candidatus Eremiobacteraeota bacterium]|nr:TonB-dependent receptor [Candidatus Eremiobacteraeota bacterium]
MFTRLLAVLLAFAILSVPFVALAQSGTSAIVGRILDTSNGLPVQSAEVRLERGATQVATTTTDANGNFAFNGLNSGDYTLSVAAANYQTISSLVTIPGSGQTVSFQTALIPRRGGLREIATVQAASRTTLQTTSTINSNLNPQLIQQENFIRAGDALSTLPQVTASTSSSQGDDETISIRGFDPTETATLLDGHPIGPIGAFGLGYDYQLAQFWGLSNIGVIYGSGATGLYGVPTIAGAVNLETLNPTPAQHTEAQFGAGDLGKTLTGVTTTGTLGPVGYALAYGVQGTDGELGPQPLLQSGLLGGGASGCSSSSSTSLPSVAPADVAACTYNIWGAYLNRNGVGKLNIQATKTTQVQLTAYLASMYADSSGNGDTDYLTPEFVAQQHPPGVNDSETLPNGASANCTNSYVVQTSTSSYECMNTQQFASTFSGPAGGGDFGRFHSAWLGDYHARVNQQLGKGQLILDGFVDNYHFLNFKGFGSNYYDDLFFTHGGLFAYDLPLSKNDVSAGVYLQHQYHNTNSGSFGGPFIGYTLTNNIYYARDTWSASNAVTVYADIDFNRSHNTLTTNFDPRVSVQYRPTSNDVVRAAWGKSTSEPDPALLYGAYSYGSVHSFNPFATCNQLSTIGSGSTPNLQPEQADDVEFSAAHRFRNGPTLEADLYDTHETNPIVFETFPLSIVPADQAIDPGSLAALLSKLNGECGAASGKVYTPADLGVSNPFNVGSATYRGFNVNAKLPFTREWELDGSYSVQSAFYTGIPDSVLQNNHFLLNGQQILGIPMQQAGAGIGYNNRPAGFSGRIDGYYVGNNNPYYRPAYWYANGYLAKNVGGVTLNLGVFNIFNDATSPWGLIGYGTYKPVNQFAAGTAAASGTGLAQGSEEFGLAPRQLFFTITFHN